MTRRLTAFTCTACEEKTVISKLDGEVLHDETAHARVVNRGWGFDHEDAFCPECWEALQRDRRRAVNLN